MSGPRGTADAVEAADAETRVQAYWERVVGSGRPLHYLVRHPRELLDAARDTRRLPRVDAVLTGAPAGALMRGELERRTKLGLPLGATGVCHLDVPAVPADYSLGRSKQTLRRKARAATKLGVTWREVTDTAEQAELTRRLDAHLPHKKDSRYRQVGSDHSYMVGSGLWAVAEDADGVPLVVAVTPHDGEWAILRLFIALGDEQEHSDARYLLTQGVVETLSARGVRHLFDNRAPHELTNGLRHFQRMLGFGLVRVRPVDAAPAPVRSLPAPAARTDADLERVG
ncbi:hypothetical protein [Geodermatophilus sp. SYSU D01119]